MCLPNLRFLDRHGLSQATVAGIIVLWCVSALFALNGQLLESTLNEFCCGKLTVLPADRLDSITLKLRIFLLGITIVPLIGAVELLRPARDDQPLVSSSVLMDAIWYVMFPVLMLVFVLPVEGLLSKAFSGLLPTAPLFSLGDWPIPVQVIVAIVVSDFFAYLNHLLRHKVPLFWHFHKTHHAQERVNAFTTYRVHPLDMAAISLIRFVPFAFLDLAVAVPAFIGWTVFLRLYEMFNHSNVRANLGVFRFVVVTPQSHRVHHSLEPAHMDRNFGNFLSVWDWIFGTQWRDCSVYPRTGVIGGGVPNGSASRLADVPKQFLHELTFPLVASWRRPDTALQRLEGSVDRDR